MARSVADVVALFNAMTGYDEDDFAMPRMAEDLALEFRLAGLAGKRLGVFESLTDDTLYSEAAERLAAEGAVTEVVSFAWESPEFFSEFLGAEMVRDLAAYLATHASAGVGIFSVSDLRAFNLEDQTRMPYGQQEVDMMAELEYTAEELEALRAELQSYARLQMENLFSQHRARRAVVLEQHARRSRGVGQFSRR